jgi:hypothetical protein
VSLKLYSVWQPLDDEDQRTAMVFGFLRHAPVEHGLSRWLSEILERAVVAKPLEPEDFWPGYTSHMPNCTATYPELVFEAEDAAGPLHVVVEAKPGSGMHTTEQLAREVVDTAHEEPAPRIALIAIGADLGAPVERPQWQAAINAALAAHGPPGAAATVYYSSWARLGDRIEAAAEAVPALAVYADDVIAQMRFKGMLGYKGAPVHEDLEDLTVLNAFELVNRSAIAARQFYRTLHTTTAFQATCLTSYWNKFEMRRNGTSVSLNQDEEWFEVSMFMSTYKKPDWPEGAGAFAVFYFAGDGDEPLLQVGAFTTSWHELLVEYDNSEAGEELKDPRLSTYPGPDLPIKATGDNSEWLYDERPWRHSEQDADIAWAIQRLRAAASVFD